MLNLTLSNDDVNLLLAGLGELPAKFSLQLIQKIQLQVQEQLQPKEAAKSVES